MCQNKINIRFANDTDTKAVINLWNMCFPDESGFNEYFFNKLYKPEYNLLLFKDDVLCSMAQMLPYELQSNGKIENVTYIYGACTHKDYRRQHLMDKLLNYSFEIDKKNNVSASILIPQEKWLFDFYAKFDYKPMFNISEMKLNNYIECEDEISITKAGDIDNMQSLYNLVAGNKYHVIRDKLEWQRQIDLFNNCGGQAICMYNLQNEFIGYAFIWLDKNSFYAQEFVFKPEYKNICIANMQRYFKIPNCKLSGLQFDNAYALGCIRKNDNTSTGYINLMLN